MLWSLEWCYQEVWFSPSAFTRDDSISRGFIRLPKGDDFGIKAKAEFLKKLNNDGKHHYTFSEISTRLMKGWEEETEVPDFKPL